MLIAIDIGTTNVKAAAFDAAGNKLCTAERANQTVCPQPGWSEQIPEQVFQNVLQVLRSVERQFPDKAARGLVFSSAMHGLMALGESGEPLCNFMLWSDCRAIQVASDLRRKGGAGEELYERTGVPVHPMSPLLKLIWLRQHRPEVFAGAHKFLGIKEYVWYRLTGRFESDFSCASASGLMNLRERSWDDLAMGIAKVSEARLPRLVSPGFCRENVPPTFSKPDAEYRLKARRFMIGASDGALANLGSGATTPGKIAITIGTSAAVRLLSPVPILDAQMRTFCYCLDENRFIVGGASNNGGNVLEWLRKAVFQSPLNAEDFANLAAGVPPGAEGLVFLPYLNGERAPLWDAAACASFTGVTSQHTQAHFVRAAMEGVLKNVRAIAAVIEEKMPIRSCVLSGGFTHNEVWLQVFSEIFQQKIELDQKGSDASVYGAYLLAKDLLPD